MSCTRGKDFSWKQNHQDMLELHKEAVEFMPECPKVLSRENRWATPAPVDHPNGFDSELLRSMKTLWPASSSATRSGIHGHQRASWAKSMSLVIRKVLTVKTGCGNAWPRVVLHMSDMSYMPLRLKSNSRCIRIDVGSLAGGSFH